VPTRRPTSPESRAAQGRLAAVTRTQGAESAAAAAARAEFESESYLAAEPARAVNAAPASGDGPTAQQVVDDFAAAGLAVPKARDNTARNCGSLGCTQLVTTDALSVVQFSDSAAQQRYAASFGDEAHAEGPIVLSYAAARTPAGKRAAYEKRLREFLAE